jgi:TolB protein
LTPTLTGGSGEIVFQSQPDPLGKETFLLYAMNVDNQKIREVLNDFIPASQPAWSPDGKMLAFASRYNQNGSSQIYTVNADGSNLQMITSMDGNNFHPTWSPNGKQIAILHNYTEFGSDIYIISAFASNVENDQNYFNLTNSDATGIYDYPEWSPNGKQIAYQAFWENNWEIFAMNADGSSEPVQLTQAKNQENEWSIQPAWSPDGKQIAFASNRNGNWDLYLMSNKGGSPKPLTRDEVYDGLPDWSPDGQLIAFSSNRDGILQIYLMAKNGSEIRLLTKMPGESTEADWRPSLPGGQ